MKKKSLLTWGVLLIFSTASLAQEDSVSQLLQLPLDQLMNIPVFSASKKEESSFDAPLSVTVLTRQQIKSAGCTSIMEALRLVPGMIVREQTNGNYDIHLRGLDNVPPNSSLIFFTNSTTLVMIDNNPVYNYLHGGTFWETLPVTLNDVEKIEVVRGPSSSMYGPNAASGVINIITKKPTEKGLYAMANAQYGNYNSIVTSATAGYKFSEKFSAFVSGNFQNRERTQTDYYDLVSNSYMTLDSLSNIKRNPSPANIAERYPNRRRSMLKYGINGFFDYNPTRELKLSGALGAQSSEVQKSFGTDGLGADITTAVSTTNYANLKASAYKFTLQTSFVNGTQAPVKGANIWKWDYNAYDAVLEYNFDMYKDLSVVPGLIYRSAVYDDSKYVNEENREGFWSGRVESSTIASSLRVDYKMLEQKLRIIASGRLDKFNYPEKVYFSYQACASYKLKNKHLFRAVQSRANRAPLIIDLFSNLDLKGPLGPGQTFLLEVRGNKNIRLLTSDMTEIGYRANLKEYLKIDLEIFQTTTKDFSDIVFQNGTFDTSASVGFKGQIIFTNLAVSTRQWGSTFSVNYVYKKFQLKPFITIQKTVLRDYSIYSNTAAAPPLPANNYDPSTYNVNSAMGTQIDHVGTPDLFGGAYLNYRYNGKWNFNMNAYFFSKYTQLHSANLTYKDGERGVDRIKAKLLLNLVVNYSLTKRITLNANFRNCLNSTSREFYRADPAAFMAFGGINFEY
jgi:iron complex outermembrane recepter protein